MLRHVLCALTFVVSAVAISFAQVPACQPLDDIRCWRLGEAAELERLSKVVRRNGDTLEVNLGHDSLRFVDVAGPGDGLRMWAVRQRLDSLNLVVISELDYSSITHHVLNLTTGRDQVLECSPLLSPDARHLFCHAIVRNDEGTQSYIEIYRVYESQLEHLRRINLTARAAAGPRWHGDTAVKFQISSISGENGEQTCTLILHDGEWQLFGCEV